MRGLLIKSVDRDVVVGETKVLLHNPTPINGLREHLAVVTKINDNGSLNLRVDLSNPTPSVDVPGVTGEIRDDRMSWWSFQDDGADADV